MRIKVSKTGQVSFFPESQLDIFTLGKLVARYKKGGTYVRWEHVYDKKVIGRAKDAVVRDLDPMGSKKYVMQSLTLPQEVLLNCIRTFILKEGR
jgi:hypothetical protein